MPLTLTDRPAAAPDAPGPEEALLGILLLEPRATRAVIGVVKSPEYFHKEANAVLFRSLVQLHERAQAGSLVELAAMLRASDALAAAGGPAYLRTLACNAPNPSAALDFAKQIVDRHRLHRMDNGG